MSAVRQATFAGFDPYKLTGVRVTDRKLGHGSYATVLELEYMGLKCAGKKIHEVLLEQGDASYTVRRFEEECRLLSQVHHPNIVQFLGVYFQQGVRAPILVMEFLPTNLTSCIEEYAILPNEISYSILHDVALGLCYLHSQTPPIIHRDLSSNNVLLTPNMTAKISDLGVARMLNLTPLQVTRMTQAPGTPAYMPPEVMVASPKYDTSVDKFSYGIMMIHMFSGQWPEPQVGQVRTEPDGRMTPVSEAERREVFLRVIGKDHPLMDLILKCIHNYPKSRAHASEIVGRLAEMVLQFPVCFANRLDEALRQIEAITRENRYLREENRRIETLDKENRDLREENSDLRKVNRQIEALDREIRDLREEKRSWREEVERKTREIQELRTANELLKMESRTAGLNLHNFSPSEATITWKKCAELPTGLSQLQGSTTVINRKVYCAGGTGGSGSRYDFTVYCYDPSQDKWTTLPPLPVKWFGLGQVSGKLVAVGGVRKRGDVHNEVYTYAERSRKWNQTIPPMPTARMDPSVLSLQSALVVVGGVSNTRVYSDAIEIFKSNTLQWYKTSHLPVGCMLISLVSIGSTCYALGGYDGSNLNQGLYASIDDLLVNAVPANQTTNSHSSAWKTLSNTPTYRPTAAVLAGNLLTIGGIETSGRVATKKEVYMYFPSTNSWIYISDLPAPKIDTGATALSSTEILVIGGWYSCRTVNTVHKGTLHLKSHRNLSTN